MAKEIETSAIPTIQGKSIDGKDVTYRIKEIQNGFVVTKEYEWKDKDGEHQYVCKEYFIKTNPVQKEADNMFDIIQGAIESTEF